jgi:hypothetical protein
VNRATGTFFTRDDAVKFADEKIKRNLKGGESQPHKYSNRDLDEH